MQYGFVLPGGDAIEQLEQAKLADQAGWDGVFIWEASYGIDPWTLLAAIARETTHVKLGTLLTPLPWRRPWKLASQALTLDQLSGGRAILTVGLGAVDNELGNTGEVTDRRTRAEMLDEGIDLITGLWEGRLKFEGRHYRMDLEAREDLARVANQVQRPRIPIWVVGAWPREKSMQRVLRCDGILPAPMDESGFRDITLDDIRDIRAWLQVRGSSDDGFDIVMEGETPAADPEAARAQVRPWAEAGCTWWIESRWAMPHEAPKRMQEVRERLAAGPPRVDEPSS